MIGQIQLDVFMVLGYILYLLACVCFVGELQFVDWPTFIQSSRP